MPYYMGDFYSNRLRGDYYRGDPGFLSFLGGLGKAALGVIPGVGPILQAAVSGIGHSAPKALPAAAGAAVATGAATSMLKRGSQAIKGAVLKHPVLSGAGAAGIIGATAGIAGTKLAEHLRGGKRHRRMRVTNVKALRRALRRAQGFEKLAMKTIHLVHPRKHVRFGGFKRRAKKRVC